MRQLLFAITALLPFLSAPAHGAECATNVAELRRLTGESAFPLRWEETSMDDGKPLLVSITDRSDGLGLEFVKHGEGLWAEGTGRVCRGESGLEAQLPADGFRLGPAANWLLRMALDDGAVFTLKRPVAGELDIATSGWSGRFVPIAH